VQDSHIDVSGELIKGLIPRTPRIDGRQLARRLRACRQRPYGWRAAKREMNSRRAV
jgi:hypothetical protein